MNLLTSKVRHCGMKRKMNESHTHISEKTVKSEESLKHFCDFGSTEWRIDESNVIHPILVVRSVSSQL